MKHVILRDLWVQPILDLLTRYYTDIQARMHACMHTYIHTYIHTYMHACMHACIHKCIHPCIHTYIPASVYMNISLYIYWVFRWNRNFRAQIGTASFAVWCDLFRCIFNVFLLYLHCLQCARVAMYCAGSAYMH